MAEIGIIASIIGVAGAGFRLSLILNAVGSEVAGAGIEIHTISKGVSLFSLMLKQIGQHMQQRDSIHSQEAMDTAKQITDECQLVFNEISDMLDRVQTTKPDGSRSSNLPQRIKWCFKKHRVTYLLAQLESLKMSLLVMLQILQLGKLMLTPPASETKEDHTVKNTVIQQERLEVQNVVVVRYWTINRLDRLFYAAEQEAHDDRKAEIEAQNQDLLESGQAQLTIEAPPPAYTSNALIKLPVVSLGELDQSLNKIKDSSRDMIQASAAVIDPLLDKWTRYHELQQHQETQPPGNGHGKYSPFVHDFYDSDDERRHKYPSEPSSPETTHNREFLLEGTTTNWREPHSVEAKQEASRLRKKYASFQPSVDTVDDREGLKPKKNAPTRHIIDSDSSSSSETDSEYEKPKKKLYKEPSRQPQPYSGGANLGRYASSPTSNHSTPGSSVGSQYPPYPNRPHPYHSVSSPVVHPGSLPNPYQPQYNTVQSPVQQPYSSYNRGLYPNPYLPSDSQRLPLPPRPSSSEEKSRSPSRLSTGTSSSHRLTDEERKRQKQRQQQNFRKGATRGFLGAGAVAGFLEALEGLSL